ncbi:ABC transporter ATP-binding protein [Paenibacillus beijingensis]|uniref:Peptide ABC transporter ATP-binding protein n=1 Tax=Paenibacillus beijingensis TaxID=1126833 RepID=A0A0D5NJC5_9BACL|nr:dipeptide ABC transporter ATP-binding protein [Paenibacillus beijingensis]AJY75102.1 peptide ABC transporter ATP-binding protein [Paenibacillus beijingensis]
MALNRGLRSEQPILEVKGLKKHFPVKGGLGAPKRQVKAINDVSFALYEGETYGLVGESGCGKSTTGRAILRLIEPSEGQLIYNGSDLCKLDRKSMMALRKEMQMIFQDPYSSLNPRKRVGTMIEEPLVIHGIGNKHERTLKALELLEKVGLHPEQYYRFPHEFSGGQRQRIGIARALAVQPKIIICDEPVSALDVSIQSQIINLLEELQERERLTYLFISHDLGVVRHMTDRIGVMYMGRIVEEAPTELLFERPLHPYTRELLAAIPVPGKERRRHARSGETPSPLNLPVGCAFQSRCPHVTERCRQEAPRRQQIEMNHYTECHLYETGEALN